MKNLTDFRKTVETGVDPRLKFRRIAVHISFTCQILHNKVQKKRNPARDMKYIRSCVKFVKETIRHKSKELTRDGSHQNFVLIIRKQKSYATTVKTSVCYKFNSLFLDNVPIISCMS